MEDFSFGGSKVSVLEEFKGGQASFRSFAGGVICGEVNVAKSATIS